MDKNDKTHEVPYYLRSKRRRKSGPSSSLAAVESCGVCIADSAPPRAYKRKNPIMHLPTEILQRILSYLNSTDLSEKMRLVNRRFKVLSEDLLNRDFLKMADVLERIKSNTLRALTAPSQKEDEIYRLIKNLNMIESLQFYHSVIMATIWRYVYREEKKYFACMYGGRILDFFADIINNISDSSKIEPIPLSQMNDLVSLTKIFCVYFDRFTEEPINCTAFTSGAKILDILDTAIFCKKQVLSERLNGNTYVAKINYYFDNSWFVALNISSQKKITWNQHQRFMYMRFRRLMFGHTEMHLAQYQYERQLCLLTNSTNVTKPWNSVYTGYGEVENIFFFYGVMNNGAYFHKFHVHELNVHEHVFEDVEGSDDSSTSYERTYTIPYLGLEIKAEIWCPIYLAPRSFLKLRHHKNIHSPYYLRNSKTTENFILKIEIESPGASYARVPTQHCFVINQTKFCL